MATSESQNTATPPQPTEHWSMDYEEKLGQFDQDSAQFDQGFQKASTVLQKSRQESDDNTRALNNFQALLHERHSAFRRESVGSGEASQTNSISTRGFTKTLRKVYVKVDGLLEEQQSVALDISEAEQYRDLVSVLQEFLLRSRREMGDTLRMARILHAATASTTSSAPSSLRRSTRIREQAARNATNQGT
ncbi:MAG: hypothetical protein Q9168_005063 [Polycauliona sp. 1 TL-2023]